MYSRIPWIISRRRKIIAITIDSLLTLSLYNYIFFKEIGSYPSKLVSISLLLFWIIVSYVLGRYIKTAKITFTSFLNALFKSIFVFLLCNLVFLVINWWLPLIFYWDTANYSNYNSRELSNLFIRVSSYISILSLLIQYFFSIITYNIYDKRNEWIFYGKESKFKDLIEEVGSLKKNMKILHISNKDNFQDINIKNTKGIIIGDFNDINKTNLDIIFKLKLKGIIVEGLLTWFEKEFHRMPTQIIENKYQLIEKLKSIEDNYQLRIKRIGDILVSLFLIILTSPIFLLIIFFIFFEDKGPLFYTQIRTGLNGQRIKIYKFRSMIINAEKNGIQWSLKSDPRVTKTGSFLRVTRLDELPQLWCVIKGDMSLIGPRPERPEIEQNFLKEIPYYKYRNILRPGISGWAQVNYPYGASILDSTKKLSFDIYYISHFSFLLDILILLKTIRIVLNAQGSKPSETYNYKS